MILWFYYVCCRHIWFNPVRKGQVGNSSRLAFHQLNGTTVVLLLFSHWNGKSAKNQSCLSICFSLNENISAVGFYFGKLPLFLTKFAANLKEFASCSYGQTLRMLLIICALHVLPRYYCSDELIQTEALKRLFAAKGRIQLLDLHYANTKFCWGSWWWSNLIVASSFFSVYLSEMSFSDKGTCIYCEAELSYSCSLAGHTTTLLVKVS